MPIFTTLPPEITHQILQHLQPNDLISLTLTSRTISPNVNRILYRSITSDRLFRLPLLLRTLLSRPFLGLLVKELHIRTSSSRPPSSHPDQELSFTTHSSRIQPLHSLAAAIASCPETNTSPLPLRLDIQEQISHDVLIALILTKVPDLEVLTLSWDLASIAPLTHGLLSHASCSCLRSLEQNHGFRKLRHLNIWNESDRRHFTTASTRLSYWPLNLQSLSRLEIVLLEPEEGKEEFPVIELPGLRELVLSNTTITTKTLSHIIKSTPNLTSLENHHVTDLNQHIDPNFTAPEVKKEWTLLTSTLLPLASTLRNLVISIDCIPITPQNYHHTLNNLAGHFSFSLLGNLSPLLHSFTTLHRLELPIFVLLSWSPSKPPTNMNNLQTLLPPNLQELCLRDDLIDTDSHPSSSYPWNQWYHYPYYSPSPSERTPAWEAHELDSKFEELSDPSALLDVLAECLPTASANGLRRVVIKNLQGRHWPLEHAKRLATLCNIPPPSKPVQCIFHARLTNTTDEVRQTTIQEIRWPKSEHGKEKGEWRTYKYRQRLIFEGRGTFYERLCAVKSEERLRREVRRLRGSGWFENFPAVRGGEVEEEEENGHEEEQESGDDYGDESGDEEAAGLGEDEEGERAD